MFKAIRTSRHHCLACAHSSRRCSSFSIYWTFSWNVSLELTPCIGVDICWIGSSPAQMRVQYLSIYSANNILQNRIQKRLFPCLPLCWALRNICSEKFPLGNRHTYFEHVNGRFTIDLGLLFKLLLTFLLWILRTEFHKANGHELAD